MSSAAWRKLLTGRWPLVNLQSLRKLFLSGSTRGIWSLIVALFALSAGPSAGAPFRPNIVLITIDTFRPDHLSYYGYRRQTSPQLDAISAEGVFFRQAFSSSAWTTPGLISILTSLYAPTHEVDIRGRRLDPRAITLPDLLVAEGYRAPDIFFLTEIPNFSNLGLEIYDRREELIDRGDEILFHWLEEEVVAGEPFFLYYHYRDLHLPYKPGESYESLYLPDAFDAPLGILSALKRFLAAEKMAVVKKSVMITRGLMDFDARDRPWIDALYDAQIRRLDEEFFGRLRRTLEREGLDENTLVIISADHGEELFDRDLIGHVSTFKEGRLYDELTRIPLIFWFPGVLPAGRIVEEPVQCIDVAPTILDLLDLPLAQGMQGQSLLSLIEERDGWTQKPLFFETSAAGYTADEEQYRQRFRAVRTERWKLIHAGPDEAYALYDLDDDPGELEDVGEEYPQMVDSLRVLLNEWILFSQRRVYRGQEDPSEESRPQTGARSGAADQTGGKLEILFPQDGDTLSYQGADHTIRLQWDGPDAETYVIEYEIGEGAYHLEGVTTESRSAPGYGPFQANMWNALVLYNPWKFRVYLPENPQEKSDWVTFYLTSSEAGKEEGISLLGVALMARHAVSRGIDHAGNLIWGLGRGAVDLYLWAGTVPAADLSAYALLLVIAGAILWPYVQRWGVARCRAWSVALLYIAFVYSTIAVMPAVWKILEAYTQGSIRYLGILAVGLAAAAIAGGVWRRIQRRRWGPYVALAFIVPIYAYLLNRYAVFPSERLHLVEYGFMGVVLFRALRIDFSDRAAYIVSFVGTVLIGLGDECIQWVLPQRFFELKDVQLNALSGGLGLLILRFVVQPAEEGVGEGTERRPEERMVSDGHHTFPE